MERVITPEERIRRAEEIYYRRKAQGVRVSTSSVNVGKGNRVLLGKKMGIQILACILIYVSFWLIKGYNNVFSENVINQTKAILSYDVNFVNLYNQCVEYFNTNFNSIIKDNNNQNEQQQNIDGNTDEGTGGNTEGNTGDNNGQENSGENNAQENNAQENNATEGANPDNTNENNANNTEENNNSEQKDTPEDLGMGGGNDVLKNAENDGTIQARIDAENKTQMEQDVEFIKQNCNIIHPVGGIVTSGFGEREETEIISAFHQGVDIGATTGTAFYAAMEGTVVAASYAGDYGNHIKIQNGDVLTVYAHCSELEVKVGDYVNQGQEIGKVGATGNVTRSSSTF